VELSVWGPPHVRECCVVVVVVLCRNQIPKRKVGTQNGFWFKNKKKKKIGEAESPERNEEEERSLGGRLVCPERERLGMKELLWKRTMK